MSTTADKKRPKTPAAGGDEMVRGGAREGAGRPAERGERKQSLTIRITPTLRAFIDQQTASAADVIEDTLRRTKAFRDWEASQNARAGR